MHWYFDVLKKYATFSGRARRMEFWMFGLINFIVSLILAIISHVAGITIQLNDADPPAQLATLQLIYAIIMFLPALAVGIRRLHDIDRSGWGTLLILVPCIGWIILIWFHCIPGTRGENRFGPDPIPAQ
ncbi:MAG: hypothetical protein CMJ32_04755 [Phycisphaerae bacterium]|nr:hypothetical protein [Phycisphaerae bacterium]